MAAKATFALKAGVWFRRGLLLIVSPEVRAYIARRQADAPLIVLSEFPGPPLSTGKQSSSEAEMVRVRLRRGPPASAHFEDLTCRA
jgi:hypothetical protein